ncbi:MAG: GNAT family N-acetyltransferase [Candidatus Micrarchaeaceae archaeon]
MRGIKIRLASQSDAKILLPFIRAEILHASHYNVQSRRVYASEITEARLRDVVLNRGVLIAAFEGGAPVACMWATFDSEDKSIMWIDWMLVERLHRHKGIGRSMLRFFERCARSMKVRKVWCDSRASNYQAIGLYRSERFRMVGILKRHWFGQDYLLWEKAL